MQLGMMVDMKRCIGCKTCIAQCRNWYGLIKPTDMPNSIPYYLRLETPLTGTFPNIKRDYRVIMCQACKDPACVAACPEGVFAKDARTGIVRTDRSKCTGCQSCIPACPYQVIQFDEESNQAHKCDNCYERVTQGLKPVCAEECMTDAIYIGEMEMLQMWYEAMGRELVPEWSKESVLYVR